MDSFTKYARTLWRRLFPACEECGSEAPELCPGCGVPETLRSGYIGDPFAARSTFQTSTTLADNSVTTAKIADLAVTTDKIANAGIHPAKLQAIGTSQLQDGIVTSAKVATSVHVKPGGGYIEINGALTGLSSFAHPLGVTLHSGNGQTVEGPCEMRVLRAYSLSQSAEMVTGGLGAGDSLSLTLRKNGADVETLTWTQGTDPDGTVKSFATASLAANDEWCLKLSGVDVAAAVRRVRFWWEMTPV